MLPAPFQVEASRSSSRAGEKTDKQLKRQKVTSYLISGWDKRPVSGVVVGLRSLRDRVQLPQLLSVQLVGELNLQHVLFFCMAGSV